MRNLHLHKRPRLFVVGVWFAWSVFSLQVYPCLARETSDNNESKSLLASKAEQRTINFPKKASIGALFLIRQYHPDPDCWCVNAWNEHQVGGAKGTVTLTVPPKTFLGMEANRRVFENPELLNQVSPEGIDALKLSFISLADSEDQLFDNAVEHVNHLTGLKMLAVDRSEATDTGLSKLKGLSKLHTICCFLSSVNGSCFKDLAKLPALCELSVAWCKIDLKNLDYLPSFPKLRVLDISKIHMNEASSIPIGKCSELIDLNVSGNHNFDDKCLRHLTGLKKLQYLDIGDTPVTISGLEGLRGIKLKILKAPYGLSKQLKELQKLFPGAAISYGEAPGRKASKSDQEDFAPLH